MPSLGTAYVAIKADSKALKPGLAKARRTVGSSVDKMRAKISQITFRAAIVGAAAFSAAVVYNLKLSIDAASDLQEVTSKFETVFKNQIPIAEKWSKELVDGYVMSTREAKQYLSSVQDLLVPMGMQAEAAGRMSFEVVKLSADLASFNNLPTAQVMNDIQSALVGNFETMKKYGVILNETVVKQKALEMGLWSGKGMVDANTKSQVAFKLMLEGSSAAIGDQQRTIGSYANQMKQLRVNFEEIRAEIGKNLLPILTPLVKSVNEWVKANKALIGPEFKEWLEAVNPLFKVFAAAASIAAQAVGGIGVIVGALGDITPRRPGVTGSWGEPDQPDIGGDQTEKDTAQQEQIERSLEIDQAAKARYLELELTHTNYLLKFREQRAADLAVIDRRISAKEIKNAEYTTKQKLSFYQQMAGGMSSVFMQIAQAGGKQSRKAFRLYQASAITEAIIGANLAAAKVLGQTGIFGIPLSAMVWGMAMSNVAMIAAAKPPSYETGTDYVPETGLALLHKGEQVIPSNRVPAKTSGGGVTIIMENPVFQDLATQRQVFAQIAEVVAKRVAPGAVIQNYNDGLQIRDMVRGGA